MEKDDPYEERPNSVVFSSQIFSAVKMSFRVAMGIGLYLFMSKNYFFLLIDVFMSLSALFCDFNAWKIW